MRHRFAIAISLVLALTACGGGGHGVSLLPTTTGSNGGGNAGSSNTLTVTMNIPSSGLPALTSAARASASSVYRVSPKTRARTLGVSLASFCTSAVLYEGAAGAAPQAGVQTSPYNANSLPSNFSFTFSNIPNGYNQWVIADVYGYSGTNCSGSTYLLGELGGLVSVGSPPAFSTIDGGSTLRLQLALAAMYGGMISTYDIQNTLALDNELGNFIGSTGVQPNPSTGLYDPSAMTTLLGDLYPIFNRTLTIAGADATASVASIVFDYRQTYEQDFLANVDETIGTFAEGVIPSAGTSNGYAFPVIGNPFAESSAEYQANNALVGSPGVHLDVVGAVEYPAPSGSVTLQHVYGGALLLGMSARQYVGQPTPPYYGGFVALAPRAQGIVTNQTIQNASNTTLSMYMTDPEDMAFSDYGGISVYPTADYFSIDCTLAADDWCPNAAGILANVTATNDTSVVGLSIDQYNPFALLAQGLQFCAGLDCFPIVSGSTVQVREPFYDPGYNSGYFAWHAWTGSGSYNAVEGSPSIVEPFTDFPAYQISYTGGTSGWIQTNTPTYVYPSQPVNIASTAPANTTFFVRCNVAGTTYSNTAVQSSSPDGSFAYVEVDLAAIPAVEQCTDLEIGFALPPGSSTSGSFDVVFPSWWDIANGNACVSSVARARAASSTRRSASSTRAFPQLIGKPAGYYPLPLAPIGSTPDTTPTSTACST